MKIKRIIAKLILNKKQRGIIWKSLIFSAYKYRKRGMIDQAVNVERVMDEISSILGIVPDKFTKKEVDILMSNMNTDYQRSMKIALNKAYNNGLKEGGERMYNRIMSNIAPNGVGIVAKPEVITLEDCDNCPNKEGCMVHSAIKECEAEEIKGKVEETYEPVKEIEKEN